MNLNDYKFVVVKPVYGDIYEHCYKDLEGYDNIDLLKGHIKFKFKLEEKIYLKHFTKKYKLPFRKLWNRRFYKTKFNKNDNLIFILSYVDENLLKYGSIKYLKKKYKNSKFVLFLSDLVIHRRLNMEFNEVKKLFDAVISFDYNDCQKYELYNHPLVYSAPKENINIEENIDVYFCGKAKDRLDIIMLIFKYLKKQGLNCKFIISEVSDNKREDIEGLIYLDKFMSYEENLEYIKKSKCLLEIMQEGGNGYTLRTCEAVAYNKKIITNNKILKDSEFYDENMMLIFQNIEDIDINFIKVQKKDYIDKKLFSPFKLLEKVVDILENKEG